MFRKICLGLMVLAALGLALPTPVNTPQTFVYGQEGYIPQFESAVCPFDVPEDEQVACGYLIVPEDRANPQGSQLRLAVAIISATSGNALPDPIIYLEGGPGGSAVYGIDSWYGARLNENRDLILIDQRGTGYSEPGLFCYPNVPEDADETTYIRACRADLEADGINLAMYTSATNAADIADLRVALGYAEVNLYGISYGTRLAMTVMRDHPQGIRSVVLDSPYPPEVDAYVEDARNFYTRMEVLFSDCAADAECSAAYPDLRTTFYDTVESANRRPIEIDYGDGFPELYSGDDIIGTFYELLYDTSVLAYLPALIDDFANGRPDTLAYIYGGEEDESVYDEPQISADDYEELSEEELDAILMEYLEYDDVDQMWDYLDSLSDDEYFDLMDEIFGDEFFSAEDEDILMDYLEIDDVDELYDYLDSLSDDDYFDLIEEAFGYEAWGDPTLSQEEEILMEYLGYDDVDEMWEYLDTLSDEDFDALMEAVYSEYEYVDEDNSFSDYLDDRSSSDPMFYSVDCADELYFNTLDAYDQNVSDLPRVIQEKFRVDFELSIELCNLWGVPPAPALEDQPVISDIPTLILTGSYDAATPPYWGQTAAAGLSRVYFFEFPGVGHSAIDAGDCPIEIGVAFINNPLVAPNAACVGQMSPPDFVIP